MIAPAHAITVRQPETQIAISPDNDLTATVSASRLALFHQCRLKFFFRYVLRLKKPKTVALHVGSVIHAVLQIWNKARWRQQPLTTEQLHESFSRSWVEDQASEPVRWGEPEAEERETAWRTLAMYFCDTPIAVAEKPEAVEVAVETDMSRHGLPRLIGFIDLVRPRGRIVDFKTSGQTPSPERVLHLNELQLSCYGVLYRDATACKESGFELHHLVKLKKPKLVVTSAEPMSEQQRTRLFRSIESYVDGVEREDWVPNPNPMTCACCEYFNECRSWPDSAGESF